MKIVLGTNVLVSAILKPYSDSGMIVQLVAGGLLEVIYDTRILAEYRDVLSRSKFGFDQEETAAIVAKIETDGVIVAAKPLPQRLPDPDDEPFLEVAKTIEGTVLVTGNKKHFPAAITQKLIVLSPGEFISFYRSQS